MNQTYPRLISILAAAGFAACGGTASETPPAVVAVTISPSSGTVVSGETLQFTAAVTGSSNTAVTWSVQEGGGGSITAAGLYTAAGVAGTYHVVATSSADTSKSASAAVEVTASPATNPQTIGPDGGTVSIDGGPSLIIPAGALSADATIGIEAVTTPSPAGGVLYHFTPGGTVFNHPIAVVFPVPASQPAGQVYWTQGGSSTLYDALPTTIANGGAEAHTNHFSFGFLGAICAQAAACASGVACHAGITDCSSGVPVCTTGDALPNGTACGTGQACSAGACVDSSPRTVSGTFSTIWEKDDGTRTTVAGLGPGQSVPTALLFPDGAGGLTSVPLTVGADGSFSVPNVPGGTYYLRTDTASFPSNVAGSFVKSVLVQLSPLTSSTPDLSTLLHGRADAVAPTKESLVTLHVTGLAPWTVTSGGLVDRLIITTPQASGNHNVFQGGVPQPAAGATTADATFDWQNNIFDGLAFLPDAAKGDTSYFYHRAATDLANGGKAVVTTRFARSTSFTVPDGGGVSASVDLQAAPLTSSLPTAAKLSAFAALVPAMNPQASLTDVTLANAGASLFSIPGSLTFPDLPGFNVFGRLGFYDYTGGLATDTDYGAMSYGGFLASSFHTMRNFGYGAGVLLHADNGSVDFATSFAAQEAADGVAATLAPVLGPVQAPLINGEDAFTAHTGVGLTPTLSWKAPSLGSASSYLVSVQMLSVPDGPDDVGQLNVAVYGATSFKIPAGMLKSGKTYAAFITAVDAASSDQNRPFRLGLPFYSTDALSNTFSP